MTDIPIGSPPVPPGRHAAPSGWYPDPVDQRNERYWDGWQWGRDTRPGAAGGPLGNRSPGGAAASPPYQPQPYGYGPAQPPPPSQPYGGYPPVAAPGGKATTTADGVPLSGWGTRALAAVIDYIFLLIVTAIIAGPLLTQMSQQLTQYFQQVIEAGRTGGTPPPLPITGSQQLLIAAITFGVGFVYHLLFLRLTRATPGKLIAGLRVVEAGRGQFTGRLGWRPAVLRALVWMLPQVYSCLVVYVVIDCLFPLWHQRRQALHDLLARTQVIRHRR